MPKNRIIPQMFDVRPVDETGDLDWKKIQSIGGPEIKQQVLRKNYCRTKSSEMIRQQVGISERVMTTKGLIPRGLPREPEGSRACPGVLIPFYSYSEPEHKNVEACGKAYILGVAVESDDTPVLHDPSFRIKDHLSCINEISKEKYKNNLTEVLGGQIEKRRLQQQELLSNQIAEQERVRIESIKRQEELKTIAEFKRAQNEARQLEIEEEKTRKQQERILQLEIEKKKIEMQQKILEEIQVANREKEAVIAEEKARIQQQREDNIRQEALVRKSQLQKIVEFNRSQQLNYEESVIAERGKREEEYEKWLKAETLSLQEEKKSKSRANKGAWWFSDEQKKKNKNLKKNSLQNFFSLRSLFVPNQFAFQFDSCGSLAIFALVAIVLSFGIGGISYASKGFVLKGRVLGVSQDGYANLTSAVNEMAHQNFEGSTQQFSKALENFSQGSKELEEMGGTLLDATRFIPFASKISSGKNAVEAGKHFSAAGQSLNEVVKISASLKDQSGEEKENEISFLDVLENAEKNINQAKIELDAAQKNVEQISIDDLPEDKQAKFLLLKQKLPDILSALDLFLDNNHILVELLGGNGPRKYLFLFQNNTEMRATGGFIGSYGLLDIANGHVKKFFIDGIFNPDGQLKEKIVPPGPIQKISANWTMHDSNWFADFPLSAKKAINFYEKTGGPTADGIITLTPTVMQKLLEITGPIEMPEYDVTLDSQNFIELTQYKVEVDYDKQENKPKKILSDLAPLVLEKLLSNKDLNSISKAADALLSGLQEKHILLYSENASLQEIISKQGWSGEVLQSTKDYISVINANINGYKTDAVVEENISHKAEIQPDGTIVDTLTVKRSHKGGSKEYDWLNKVNADYMRVYVPEGSKLLEVSGQTRETNTPPLDYDALGFKRDDDLVNQENNTSIDAESGTRIYNEAGKTVFANWTYVSPGETMTITYKYLLPFSLFKVSVGSGEQIDSYSLVAQKQSGSMGSSFASSISFPENYNVKWNFPQDAQIDGNEVKSSQPLKSDRYQAVVFENMN